MKMFQAIPNSILQATIALLTPYVPDLDMALLRKVLGEFAAYSKDRPFAPDPMLSKKDTARALGLSISTINRMLRDGQLPHQKVRGSVRIPAKALEALTTGSD